MMISLATKAAVDKEQPRTTLIYEKSQVKFRINQMLSNFSGKLAVIALLCVFGCEQRNRPVLKNIEPAYLRGISENTVRERVGLRVIQPTWICFRSIDGKDEWVSSQDDDAAVKVVQHNADTALLWETDSYVSGRVISDLDSEYQEEIKLRYDYQLNELKVIYLGVDKEIESWVADSVGDNSKCLAVIERVKEKWFGDSVSEL